MDFHHLGSQVHDHLQRVLLDEEANVARGERLEVVGPQQRAADDDTRIGGPVQREPARRVVLSAHPLIVAGGARGHLSGITQLGG